MSSVEDAKGKDRVRTSSPLVPNLLSVENGRKEIKLDKGFLNTIRMKE